MKNCLLMGYFGHHNLGDDLLYKESIERMPRDFRVYVLSDGQYTSDLLDDRVELIKSFKDILKRNYELSIVNGGGQYPTLGFGKKELMLKFLIRLRSKLMVINGVGIVPKKGFWNNKRFATYLRMLDYISVRDNVSKHYVDRLLGGVDV